MPYAGCAVKIEGARQAGCVFAEFVPFVWRLRPRTGAVRAHIKGNRAAFGNARDDLTPAVRVKARGVGEQNRRFCTTAFPYCKPRAIDIKKLRAGQRLNPVGSRIRHSLDSKSRWKRDP